MKIFYFTPYFLPQSEAAAVRSYWFVKTLRENKHQVFVASSIKNDQEGSKLFFSKSSNKSSAIIRLFLECLLGFELFFRILFGPVRDLYILSSPPFFSCLIASWAARIRRRPYLIDVRDLYPEVFFEFKLVSKESILGRLILWFTNNWYKQAKYVVTVTHGLSSHIQKNYLRKVLIIQNGFDSNHFSPSNSKYPDFTVIFHGTMGKVQDIELILDTAKLLELEKIQFIFIGSGPKDYLLKETKLQNVKYLGHIPYSKLPEIINSSHIGISARVQSLIGQEALPVKIFEYLGSGIPVICTPSGDIAKVLEDTAGGVSFTDCDAKLLAKTILNFRSNYQIPDRELTLKYSRQELSKEILKII